MKAHQHLDALTNRETEILDLLAAGMSNKEIAETLFIEVTTVKWFNSQIYDKLGVRNRKQAVIRARTIGILKSNEKDQLYAPLHNLPADTLPFIGRQKELHHLAEKLTNDNIRHITIQGLGGMGKTRLAIEVGRHLLTWFRDGVYYISLAPITAREQIVTTIAQAIQFKFHSDTNSEQQLIYYLKSRQMLLIMDNFEHLILHSGILSRLLSNAPQLKILVTSREKLALSGEVVYLISGLSLGTAESADAVKLFVEVANRIPIQLQGNDRTQIVEICRILGGIPLAILLAASWLDTLSISEIKAEIEENIEFLEIHLRDMPTRHQSMRRVFNHSWQRLSVQEQSIFTKLSVFREGFTRHAAKSIAGANIHHLKRLVQTSFIQHLPSGRYVIHELMRQYGETKLRDSGEFDVVCDKHARYFATVLTPLSAEKWGMGPFNDTLEKIHADFNNILVAWSYHADRINIAELRQFADGLWFYFDAYGRGKDGIEIFEPLLSVLQTREDKNGSLFYGQLLARYAWLNNDVGNSQIATNLSHQALKIFQLFDAKTDILFAYRNLYWTYRFTGNNTQSLSYAQQGLDLAKTIASKDWIVVFSIMIGGDYMVFERYDEALELIEAQPDCPFKLFVLAFLLMKMGDYPQAEAMISAGLETARHDRVTNMFNYRALAECALQKQDFEKARAYIVRGLQYVDAPEYAWGCMDMLVFAVKLLIGEDEYHDATALISMIVNHPATLESTISDTKNDELALRNLLVADEFEFAWEHGKKLNLEDVITDLMER